MSAIIVAAALALGFVAGAVYEATRKNGSQDLAAQLHGRPKP